MATTPLQKSEQVLTSSRNAASPITRLLQASGRHPPLPHMPQGGRQPPRKARTAAAAGAGAAAAAAAAAVAQGNKEPPPTESSSSSAAAWQRSSGGFSGAKKKDYLKWKRQQRNAARSAGVSTDEDDDERSEHQQTSQAQKPATSNRTGTTQQQQQSQQQQQARQQRTQRVPVQIGTAAQPLVYRPLVEVPAEAATLQACCSTASAGAGAADAPATTFMPRLDHSEVGFTPAGFALDMPTRPKWQGVVSTAEELHALEEAEFAAWQAALGSKTAVLSVPSSSPADMLPLSSAQQSDSGSSQGLAPAAAAEAAPAPAHHQQQQQQEQQQQQAVASSAQGLAVGPGPVSCYEGRLEFWRQLWRTLEMSDIMCMIVDARNPLLHFSYALYRHITQDHGLPLILLLNKCDLIPPAAAASWQQWLQQQLPGVTVIPVSACEERASATAKQVLSVVLQQQVLRGGRQIAVQQWLQMSADELIEESVRRNTHAKRHLESLQQQQQQEQSTQCEAADSQQPAPAAAVPDVDDGDGAGGTDGDSVDDWSTKPSRGVRKAGRKAGRSSKHRHKLAAHDSHHPPHQRQHADLSASDLEPHADAIGDSQGSDIDSDGLAGSQRHPAQREALQAQKEAFAALNEALDSMTLERRLSSSTASAGMVAPGAVAAAAGAAGAAAASSPSADTSTSMQQGGDHPVVIGLVGEPNVGKSRTLNTLLGAHRVAVSSHPGRTKHYQTLYMCDKLVLVDCPGVVFPRLNVSPAMQVLFGSSPIASCREPYAVVRYLAEASWPRLQDILKLHAHLSSSPAQHNSPQDPGEEVQHQLDMVQQQEQQQQARSSDSNDTAAAGAAAAVLRGGTDSSWSPWSLCEALAAKRHWVLPRSGRLDTYRAANWLLRAALAGQEGVGLAFLPPLAVSS